MNPWLPIDDILPSLLQTLRRSPAVVLSAPPGAGKTTRIPLALLENDMLGSGRLVVLEPRRLAAVRAAQYMASLLGEPVGRTVGYRIRGEARVSPATRIEIVTEGILTRMLHAAPELPGVTAVVFDEFHERSIHADLGLALVVDVQTHLRPDLKLLVMSATLNGVAVARLLQGAPVIESMGRTYSVDTRYSSFSREGPVERMVADAVMRALDRDEGDILVFLPGQREIRRVERQLQDRRLPGHIAVRALYGDAPSDQQQLALTPGPPGGRKVILSTSVAETSITIDGVRIVIDSGLSRGPQFDPRRGMSGLVTRQVSRATADQRRGRAGRQAPGICYRLWKEEDHPGLPAFAPPEILVTDLAPLMLDATRWGDPHLRGLRFLDQPPAAHVTQAHDLLKRLGAVNSDGAITDHGRRMSELPVHPRLSHMILVACDLGWGAIACDLAALLEDREILDAKGEKDIDIATRLEALQTGRGADRNVRERVLRESQRLREISGVATAEPSRPEPGVLLALAYPERIAKQRKQGSGQFLMAGGTGATVPAWSPLARQEFLAVAEVDGSGTDVRVFLAARLPIEEILEVFSAEIVEEDDIRWDPREESVIARRVSRLGALVLREKSADPESERVLAAFVGGLRTLGPGAFPWEESTQGLRSRSEWLRLSGFAPPGWPDLSDDRLLETLDQWLGPFVHGKVRRTQIKGRDLSHALTALFSRQQLKDLDRLAPATVMVPTGSQIRVSYVPGASPALPVKLQEMFGQTDSPRVAGGRFPLQVHLLSPAGRPLAVTQDLRSFWTTVYPDVRKEMRGRYPKHHWPDDPLAAQPTRKTKRRNS
jgi:ATP-dependent helicase HrpB